MIINMLEDKKEPEQENYVNKESVIWYIKNDFFYGTSTNTGTSGNMIYYYTICT